jgi:hypothetical protein
MKYFSIIFFRITSKPIILITHLSNLIAYIVLHHHLNWTWQDVYVTLIVCCNQQNLYIVVNVVQFSISTHASLPLMGDYEHITQNKSNRESIWIKWDVKEINYGRIAMMRRNFEGIQWHLRHKSFHQTYTHELTYRLTLNSFN